MIKSILVAFILLAFLFSGCIEQLLPETQYAKNGFSFTCPKGWTLEEGSNYENISFVVICKNENAGGIVSFVLTLSEIDLNEAIELQQNILEEKFLDEGFTPNFGEIKESKFKDFNALTVDYNVLVLNVQYKGNNLTINCNNKNITMNFQEAIEDHSKNLSGLEKIKESFKCE